MSLNPINMAVILDVCEKAFHRMLQKLVYSWLDWERIKKISLLSSEGE